MSDAIYHDNPGMTQACAAATNKYLRLTSDANSKWAIADASTKSTAVAWGTTAAADEQLAARFHTAGTTIMIASGAITAGALVYAAASGKVAATGTVIEGRAVNAAAADGDQIRVIPNAQVA